jgi:transcriptional regulator with XRE-family HTH domain
MTADELKALRSAIDLKQTEMAREMGLAVRLYQDLENGKKPIRARHINSAERVSMHFAVSKKNPMLALPVIRQEALDLVDMIRGYSPVPSPTRGKGQFQLVEIELGPYGEMVSRKVVPHPFRTRDEAEKMAKRAAESHQDAHGYNEEHGYWWGRDFRNKVYRFIIEPV